MTYIPFTERHGRSIADLHEQLGEAVSRLPQSALPPDRPTFGCSFRSIPVVPQVDTGTIERLQDVAANARAEMGEERWAALNAEWQLEPAQVLTERRGK